MSSHSTDSIVRVAEAGAGSIILGGNLSADSVVRIINSTEAPITVKAGSRSADSLVRFVQAGGVRITIDFS